MNFKQCHRRRLPYYSDLLLLFRSNSGTADRRYAPARSVHFFSHKRTLRSISHHCPRPTLIDHVFASFYLVMYIISQPELNASSSENILLFYYDHVFIISLCSPKWALNLPKIKLCFWHHHQFLYCVYTFYATTTVPSRHVSTLTLFLLQKVTLHSYVAPLMTPESITSSVRMWHHHKNPNQLLFDTVHLSFPKYKIM